MQRFANIYYGKLVLALVIILSIMSNTLFSLGYILVLYVLMFKTRLFLNVEDARKTLNPILNRFVLPYMIFELMCNLAYSLPIDAFNPDLEHGSLL